MMIRNQIKKKVKMKVNSLRKKKVKKSLTKKKKRKKKVMRKKKKVIKMIQILRVPLTSMPTN